MSKNNKALKIKELSVSMIKKSADKTKVFAGKIKSFSVVALDAGISFKDNQLKDWYFLAIDKIKDNTLSVINYILVISLIIGSFKLVDHNYLTIAVRLSLMALILVNLFVYFKEYINHGMEFKGYKLEIKKRFTKNKLRLYALLSVNSIIVLLLFIKGWYPFAFVWFFIMLMKISKRKY